MVIWALIPAHNEERAIYKTIKSLQSQTIKPQRIVVIADNCSDDTIKIAKFKGAEVFITKNNKNKKAGAYNQFLQSIKNDEVDFLLLMDADTVVAKNAIEIGIKHFKNKNVAAVCSKAGVQAPNKKYNFIEKILYGLQKIEYGIYDSQRVQTIENIKVIHGMAALHRWKYLKNVGMFNEDCITEDYYLTLMYKSMGYSVTLEIKMIAWTIVPVDIAELCIQRIRWNRGGVDALRDIGWNIGTYKDIIQHIWGNVINIALIYIYIKWIFYIIETNNYHFSYHWLILLLIMFCMYDKIYRIRNYVDNLKIQDWLIAFIAMPLYNQLQTVLLYVSYTQSLLETNKNW